ncbi:vWA domain-containing protein [Lactococcus lactis]|nr:VWA domain-containing protein [Lactococcus lactis]MDA2884511.1 VWA domain-containing protein [Lactococcus lactis]MDA2887011.1 VWA domain-containing protein [Lactococcus lactis]MDA2907699.1 VWA domain-containing protein [Lactococcus lactis]
MIKKWTVCLSIIILVLNFVPNLLQGHQVFAENQKNYKDKVELINDESFNISYSMQALENQYEWEIDYRINKTENDKELKLKFSFEGNQPIEIEENESWTLKEKNTIISDFEKENEGKIVLRANNSISLLNLEIQADAKLIENDQEVISEDILAKNESTIFSLYIPENNKADSKEKDNKNTEEVLNNESSQEETVSQLKKDSQLAFSYPSNFGIKASFNDLAQNYENISPEYRQDETGISRWNSFSSQWDGVNSWNGEATNLENSYIEYAGVNNPVDFALRKYAKETETPGLYDVYLNVRGNVQNPIKPVDIVLVIDMSGSMQGAKETAVRQGVSDFLSTIQNTAYADYVNVGIVGYSSPGNYVTGASGYITVPIDKVSSESHVKSINQALAPQFSGGTFTQLGLRKGTEMLEQDSSDNQKMMILMTDGVPTFSYKVNSASKVDNVIYGQSFAESRDEPGNTSKIQSPYSVKDINGGSNIEIRDTWAATLGEAEISKQEISEIHTLGIQLGNDGSYLSQEEVKSRTSLIATTGLYQDANSANDITDYLKN